MTIPPVFEQILTKYFRFVAAGIVVVFLVAGYFLVLQSKITTIQSLTSGQKTRADQQLKDQKALVLNLQASLDNYKKIFTDDQVAKLDGVLPVTSDFPTVMLTVKKIATAANLSLDNLSIALIPASAGGAVASTASTGSAQTDLSNELASTANLAAQDVSISVSGSTSYQAFKQFLRLLESSQRIFDVMTLSYTTPSDNTTGAVYTLTVRTYAYQTKTTTTK